MHLSAKPAVLHSQAAVNQDCLDVWSKNFNQTVDRIPPVVHYAVLAETCGEGKFRRVDLQKQVDKAMKALGRGFQKLNADEKRKFLDRLNAQEEFRKIKAKLNMEGQDDKIGALKQEMLDLKRQDKHKQNTKSFSLINDLVNKEIGRQEEEAVEQRNRAMEARIKTEQRDRKRHQTTKTIFEDE